MSTFIKKLTGSALILFVSCQASYANQQCLPTKEIVESNNLILSDGTIIQPDNVKAIRAEFYSDNNYIYGYQYVEFDRCEQINLNSLSYTFNTTGITNQIYSKLLQVSGSWSQSYDLLAEQPLNDRNKTEIPPYHKEGNIDYHINNHGLITSSNDSFTINDGDQSSGESRYYFDTAQRLTHYTTRSDDGYSSGSYYFTYDHAGKLISSQSPGSYLTYIYDNQDRIFQIFQLTTYSNGIFSRQLNCVKWDNRGGCTKSVTDALEIYPDKTSRHQQFFSSATYQYWDE